MLYRFSLNGTEVDEPKDFVSFESELERSFEAHGLIFNYASGSVRLAFFGSGKTILENAWNADGFNASVTLLIESRATPEDSFTTLFTGDALFDSWEYDLDYFSIEFQDSNFQNKLLSRLDTKVRLKQTIDLDGNALSGSIAEQSDSFNDVQKDLTGTRDFREGGYDVNSVDLDGGNQDMTAFTNVKAMCWAPDFDAIPVSDVDNWIDINEFTPNEQSLTTDSGSWKNFVGLEGGGGSGGDDNNYKYPFFSASEDLDVTVTLKLKYTPDASSELLSGVGTNPNGPRTEYSWVIEQWRGTTLQNRYDSDTSGLGNWGDSEDDGAVPNDTYFGTKVTADKTVSPTINMDAGDVLVLYYRIRADDQADAGNYRWVFDLEFFNDSSILINAVTRDKDFTVKHYLIYDVIERLVYILTGSDNRLDSEFLQSTDSGGSSDGCGSLLSLTNGNQLRNIDEDLEISLKECLDAVNLVFNTGWAIIPDSGSPKLKIALMEDYYSNAEIVDLGTVYEFSTAPFEELAFNRVEMGFSKFSVEEDVEGTIEDFATIATYATPLSAVATTNEGRTAVYRKVSDFSASQELIADGFRRRSDLTKQWKHDDSIFMIALRRSASNLVPENDQNFDSVGGLDYPETAYNVRYAPLYCFINHSLLVNSSLFGVSTSEEYQNTTVRTNKNFAPNQEASYACKLKDDGSARTATGDITISDNNGGSAQFEPMVHSFKADLTASQRQTIQDDLTNEGSNNYGYVSYTDEEGNSLQGFVLTLKWNSEDEIGTFTCLKRKE